MSDKKLTLQFIPTSLVSGATVAVMHLQSKMNALANHFIDLFEERKRANSSNPLFTNQQPSSTTDEGI